MREFWMWTKQLLEAEALKWNMSKVNKGEYSDQKQFRMHIKVLELKSGHKREHFLGH